MSTQYAELVRLVKLGQLAERRRKAVKAFVERLIVEILVCLFRGWMLMLGIAIIHHNWWPAIPTVGYWWAALLVGLLHGVFSHIPNKKAAG